MKITVVIPNLNTHPTWQRTLEGLKANKSKIDTVIIVDGFSDDNSGNLLKAALFTEGIKSEIYFRTKAGIIDAIYFGIMNVKTDFCMIHTCGDILKNIPSNLSLRPGKVVYGSTDVVSKERKFLYRFVEKYPEVAAYRMPRINLNSAIWFTTDLLRLKSLKLKYKISSDHALLLEAYNRGIQFEYQPELRALFFADGISSHKEMLVFGFGEGFYITFHYGSKIKSLFFATYILLRYVKYIKNYFSGYNNAARVNR